MKKLLIICGLLFSVITFAQAQDAQGGGGQGGRRGGTPEEMAKRNTDRIAEKLKLTDEQKTKVQAIYVEQGASLQKLRTAAPNGDREAMRAAMTKSTDETNAKVEALLNDDQKKAFTEYKAERAEAMKRGRGGNGGQGGQGDQKPASAQ